MTMTRILRRNCQNLNLAGHQNLQVGMVNQESKRTTKGAPVSCRNAQKESEDQHLATMEWKASTQFAILPLLQFANALATTYHHVEYRKSGNLVVLWWTLLRNPRRIQRQLICNGNQAAFQTVDCDGLGLALPFVLGTQSTATNLLLELNALAWQTWRKRALWCLAREMLGHKPDPCQKTTSPKMLST